MEQTVSLVSVKSFDGFILQTTADTDEMLFFVVSDSSKFYLLSACQPCPAMDCPRAWTWLDESVCYAPTYLPACHTCAYG
jgi:hypothetical protein